MKLRTLLYLPLLVFLLIACSADDDATTTAVTLETPANYSFIRDGESTVAFDGQTTRIAMAEALVTAMNDFDATTTESLRDMFANSNNPFTDPSLNESSKNIKSKVAASQDYFSSQAATSAAIRAQFEDYFLRQVNEVFPAQMTVAAPGVAGQIDDGSSTRYVNAIGLEYDQAVAKGLIGALMLDQTLNNYLSPAVLDQATNRADNDNGILVEGKNYTTMEHKWDEAFGYVYGASPDPANANATVGADDSFINKYLGRLEGDEDFAGTSTALFDAFKLGRAAIVAKDYDLRDAQANRIQNILSELIAIRSVYYLQQAKIAFANNDLGAAFHDLSEGYGFIHSLQFTKDSNTNQPYFSRAEVLDFIDQLTEGDGFWDITPATLDQLSETIAAPFEFTVAQAAN